MKASGKESGRDREVALLRQELRRLKKERLDDVRRAAELEEIYETTLENFMTALDMRDFETYGHSKTVARYSQVLAEALGIRDGDLPSVVEQGAAPDVVQGPGVADPQGLGQDLAVAGNRLRVAEGLDVAHVEGGHEVLERGLVHLLKLGGPA